MNSTKRVNHTNKIRPTDFYNKAPRSIRQCLYYDAHKYNPVPDSFFKKLYLFYTSQRYSMPVLLRLTELFYKRYKVRRNRFWKLLADYCKRRNEVLNQFEHGYFHSISSGTLFHHTNVTISSGVTIEPSVQIFKNITLAYVNKKACYIGANTIVFSHSIILGKRIGENCVIGAGSVVTKDFAANSVIAGNPAKIIDGCDDSHLFLEYQ